MEGVHAAKDGERCYGIAIIAWWCVEKAKRDDIH
jgi:hypothetical protein